MRFIAFDQTKIKKLTQEETSNRPILAIIISKEDSR